MKRLLLGAYVLALLAVVTGYGILSARAAAENERLRQFQQNRELIQKLVRSGVDLAGEKDRFKRVEYCNKLAESLTAEMQQAARDKDGTRFEELGRHLRTLQHGMADNVKSLPAQDDKIPALEKYLMGTIKPLEDQLQQAPDKDKQQDVQRALQGVREGQAEVENALKERKSRDGKPDRRGSGSGKNDTRFKD